MSIDAESAALQQIWPSTSGLSLPNAAVLYAKAGFCVVPIDPTTKNAGSILGVGWPAKSSCDPDVVGDWWRENPDAGIGIHTGASGLVVIDVDLDELPEELEALRAGLVHFSRANTESERGHYIFATCDTYTSGKVVLADGTVAGEVRSGNTIIVVEPTPHSRGGRYHNPRPGEVPSLTPLTKALLVPAPKAGDRNVKAFFAAYTGNEDDNLAYCLDSAMSRFGRLVDSGEKNRHDAMFDVLCLTMKEAHTQAYPAKVVAARLREIWLEVTAGDPTHDKSEFNRMLRDAVSRANTDDPIKRRQIMARTYGTHTDEDDADWAAYENRQQNASTDDEPSSWAPVDLSVAITGPALLPTIGARVDGQCLFYAGKIHWIYGDYEAGKTWFVMLMAAQVLDAGGNVLYIDYEDDGGEVARRMLALGVPKETIIDQSRFCYIRPTGSVKATKAVAELTQTLAQSFNFVVLDGVTEAMGLESLNPDKGVDAAMWQHMVPRRIANTTGAAVACLDHIPKDKDNQRQAIGSTHKMGGVDGAAFKLINDAPFGRGKIGASMVLVTKDRPGALRGIEDADYDRKDRSHHVGNLAHNASDPENITAVVELPKPPNRTTDGTIARPTWCMEQVSDYWQQQHDSAKRTKNKTVSHLYDREKKRKPDTRITLAMWRRAVDVLESEGYARRGTGQTDGYRLSKPYQECDDPTSEAYFPSDQMGAKDVQQQSKSGNKSQRKGG